MVKSDVVENNCGASIADIREEIEDALEGMLSSQIEKVVSTAQQKYHSDFLKLGDVFRNKFPREWQKLGSDWDATFSKSETSIEVKATIQSTVLKAAERGVK
ncbi:hypothetical protein D3C85_1283850 [compost metagenome]